MYKHECVECLRYNHFRCIWNIGFFDRFFGTDKVKYCVEYLQIKKANNRRLWRKKIYES
jgi:hypothetical protein